MNKLKKKDNYFNKNIKNTVYLDILYFF